jgi:putative transposase
MGSLYPERRRVNSINLAQEFATGIASVVEAISRKVNQQLATDVNHFLGRLPYRRRAKVPASIESGCCARCGSHLSRRFSRNGVRPRTLLTPWGELHLELPRVICQCGGSVRFDWGVWLRPYQRLSTELEQQIQRWGRLCLSLRQMQHELNHSFIGALGLRTLVRRLHQLRDLPFLDQTLGVPPVVELDAIWFTQLRPNGQVRRDAKGRRRAVKGRFKRPVLIALGLWPETGQSQILAWQLADSEGEAAWEAFLTILEEHGLRGQNGLELIIHDGGTGLCAALEMVHFGAAEQRCLFHKLRNIARALQLPNELSLAQRRRRRKAILKDFQAIWQAKQYHTVLRRYRQVVRQYRQTQPQAVATLRRDFRATLTYFTLLQRHPHWDRSTLRTTSHLERFNENLRAHSRVAGAYHSDAGIAAVVVQEAAAFNSGHTQRKAA